MRRLPPASLLLACLLIGATVPASAQQAQPIGIAPPGPGSSTGQPAATIVAEPVALLIAACDANGDARVTAAELSAFIARSFAATEGAGTGSIGYIAYSDWALKWLGDRNALPSPFSVDADHDDRITLPEMQDQFARLFARFDVDKDGVATRAELLTIKSGLRDPVGRGKRGGKP
ncbi:EF-hand domain-containing protein [Sphingomonas sp. So64.6b]|uniref:EF-hand domain-containing protein n=1 Tax=Sphingomonas sp. So64.6b TaxID=2997354 RepID=UPI001601BD55|nr:EF-hand domain-containing protein [Sphingomonas sp. So64.6b]QNA85010.1 EF-hand domain-containing protein [Sphingomonas sp. So64.6b]